MLLETSTTCFQFLFFSSVQKEMSEKAEDVVHRLNDGKDLVNIKIISVQRIVSGYNQYFEAKNFVRLPKGETDAFGVIGRLIPVRRRNTKNALR